MELLHAVLHFWFICEGYINDASNGRRPKYCCGIEAMLLEDLGKAACPATTIRADVTQSVGLSECVCALLRRIEKGLCYVYCKHVMHSSSTCFDIILKAPYVPGGLALRTGWMWCHTYREQRLWTSLVRLGGAVCDT